MILIDTNVISELWSIEPNPAVLSWLDAQAVESLYLSTITLAELLYGIAAMPSGKRQTTFQQRLQTEVLPLFDSRVLSFDLATAKAYAELMARAKTQGLAIGKADGYIAATAAAHGLMVATRDVSPFQAAGLRTINPWDSTPCGAVGAPSGLGQSPQRARGAIASCVCLIGRQRSAPRRRWPASGYAGGMCGCRRPRPEDIDSPDTQESRSRACGPCRG